MLPSGFFQTASMVVEPELTPVATPFPEACPVEIVAMDVMLDFQESCAEFVTSSTRPVVPEVPNARN
jgi:hypothetical protein